MTEVKNESVEEEVVQPSADEIGEHSEEAPQRKAQRDVEHNWKGVHLTMGEQQRRIQEIEEQGLTTQQKDDYKQLSNDYLQEHNSHLKVGLE